MTKLNSYVIKLTRQAQNELSEASHEIKLAKKFCFNCQANLGGERFPNCKEGCVTSEMVPGGSITVEDINPPQGCLAERRQN